MIASFQTIKQLQVIAVRKIYFNSICWDFSPEPSSWFSFWAWRNICGSNTNVYSSSENIDSYWLSDHIPRIPGIQRIIKSLELILLTNCFATFTGWPQGCVDTLRLKFDAYRPSHLVGVINWACSRLEGIGTMILNLYENDDDDSLYWWSISWIGKHESNLSSFWHVLPIATIQIRLKMKEKLYIPERRGRTFREAEKKSLPVDGWTDPGMALPWSWH